MTTSRHSGGTFAAASTCQANRDRPRSGRAKGAAAYLVEDQTGPVAVLIRGGVDNDPHRQPFVVAQGADLAALAGVVTHLVVVTAPFSADLIDWLSRTAAEGPTSRLIRSRNAIMQLGPDRLPDAIAL